MVKKQYLETKRNNPKRFDTMPKYQLAESLWIIEIDAGLLEARLSVNLAMSEQPTIWLGMVEDRGIFELRFLLKEAAPKLTILDLHLHTTLATNREDAYLLLEKASNNLSLILEQGTCITLDSECLARVVDGIAEGINQRGRQKLFH